MKKVYVKPQIEIEKFELSENIAGNCGKTVSFGPEAPGKVVCEEFVDAFEVMPVTTYAVGGNRNPFYADGAANCDCYYSSGGEGYFTS